MSSNTRLAIGRGVFAGVALGIAALGGYFGLQAAASGGLPDLPPGAIIRYEGDQLVFELPGTPLPTDGPYFRGILGDFLVVGSDFQGQVTSCPGPYAPAPDEALSPSELYSLALEPGPEGGMCSDGTIVAISNYGDPENKLARGRLYFSGAPKVVFDAPRERLQLLTVAGKPGIAEVPMPRNPASTARLAVIQRFPDDGVAGVLVWVEAHPDDGGLDAAIRLAEAIMEASGR